MSHISLSQAADKKFVEQTCRSFPLSSSFLLVPSFLPSFVFSSITIKIFLTHGGLYRDLTQRFLFRDFYGAGLGPRLMKRRTVGSRKPIFEKDGLSLEIYCYISLSLSLSTYLPSTSIVLRESRASVFLFARGFTKEPGQCRGNLSIIITG